MEMPWSPGGRLQALSCVDRYTFFSAKIDIHSKSTNFWVLVQLPQRPCPFKFYRHSVQGGTVHSNSYCTIVKTHRDEASQVTDLNLGWSTSNNVRH